MTPEQKRRNSYLLRTYGITLEEYDEILQYQGGVCPVCERPPNPGENFGVDHDHTSKRVRGIACSRCNLRVIAKNRDPERLRRTADYLEAPPASFVLPAGHKVPTKKRQPRKRKRNGK